MARATSAGADRQGGPPPPPSAGYLAGEGEGEGSVHSLLHRVPENVSSRFCEGGFCKWGKEWLPILELSPLDVEPGPVRDMWLEMFLKSEASGRAMKRLVLWYGVDPEDRGRAYSFVNAAQLVDYKKGKKEGYHNIPKKILNKIAKQQKLSKREEQHQRGLIELKRDMKVDRAERAKWMLHSEECNDTGEEVKSGMPKKVKSEHKREHKSEQTLSSAVPDGVVSSISPSPPKKARLSEPHPSPVASSRSANLVKAEAVCSSTISASKGDKSSTSSAGPRPTPEECHLVVQELGKLHPDIIALNDQRRELFALQEAEASSPDAKNTPITDAIISTMLSQNTTAANQNRAFAALKKAYPVWDQVANETKVSRIEDAIRVAGLAQIRAERMQIMLKTVQQERGAACFEYLQHFDSTEDIQKELLRFKGMGPKTVSCILLFALGWPDFPVDTHVLRISKQMNWIGDLNREAAYQRLNSVVPDEYKLDLHCLLVTHGKQCNKCAARGRAQFPPKVHWVCPMSDIRSGKLVVTGSCAGVEKLAAVKTEPDTCDSAGPFALDKKPAAVKEETDINRLFRC